MLTHTHTHTHTHTTKRDRQQWPFFQSKLSRVVNIIFSYVIY